MPRKQRSAAGSYVLLGLILGILVTLHLLPRNTPPAENLKKPEVAAQQQAGPLPGTDEELQDFPGEEIQTDEEVGLTRPLTAVLKKPSRQIAPFQIKVSQDADYYVCLVDAKGRAIASYYVRSGETLNTKVPLGSFKLIYAAGETWFGESMLFGDKTLYSKASNTINFSIDNESVQGVGVELILQRNGNFPTTQITREQFLNLRDM